ncbi:MAG: nucleotidyltransferase family protein [Eubacterium sp.]|nr:nucleotidyltransferase family protein [Eubacterium sp.]
MKTAAVIAEYNPFHNGHAYQLQTVREQSGAEFLIVVMSGDFVQRGEPAIVDKYLRTQMALDGGANLVLELPCAASTGSAGEFASAAVAVLDKTGIVDELWFGSECGRIEPFLEMAQCLAEETEDFRKDLQASLAAGSSYPAARALAAVRELRRRNGLREADAGFCPGVPAAAEEKLLNDFLAMPNNLLGLEYCIALRKSGSRIVPHTMLRAGAGHHDLVPEGAYASAGAIRKLLEEAWRDKISQTEKNNVLPLTELRRLVPESTCRHLQMTLQSGAPVLLDDFSEQLFYQLLKEDRKSIQQYHGVTESLANRILTMTASSDTVTDLAEQVKARHLTRTGINRILCRILLGISEEDVLRVQDPVYIRVLGFRGAGSLLAELKKRAEVPYYFRFAEIPEDLYRQELFASQLYERVRAWKAKDTFLPDWKRQVLK